MYLPQRCERAHGVKENEASARRDDTRSPATAPHEKERLDDQRGRAWRGGGEGRGGAVTHCWLRGSSKCAPSPKVRSALRRAASVHTACISPAHDTQRARSPCASISQSADGPPCILPEDRAVLAAAAAGAAAAVPCPLPDERVGTGELGVVRRRRPLPEPPPPWPVLLLPPPLLLLAAPFSAAAVARCGLPARARPEPGACASKGLVRLVRFAFGPQLPRPVDLVPRASPSLSLVPPSPLSPPLPLRAVPRRAGLPRWWLGSVGRRRLRWGGGARADMSGGGDLAIGERLVKTRESQPLIEANSRPLHRFATR